MEANTKYALLIAPREGGGQPNIETDISNLIPQCVNYLKEVGFPHADIRYHERVGNRTERAEFYNLRGKDSGAGGYLAEFLSDIGLERVSITVSSPGHPAKNLAATVHHFIQR